MVESREPGRPHEGRNKPLIEAVVFDLDGVLIDSEPVWEEVRRQVSLHHGGRWGPDTQQRIMGMNTPEWARYLSEEVGVGLDPNAVAKTVIAGIRERYHWALPLLPGAIDAVRRCSRVGWPLGIASSSPIEVIELVLDLTGIAPLFTAVVSSDEVGAGKPAPDVYLLAARRLGRPPETCAAIEDSTNGIRAAAAAGLRVVAVPRPNFPPAADALGLADLVLDGLDGFAQESLEQL